MNKHAMYMVLCIDKDNMQYYSMLYYALETWEKFYNGDYDVFVSVSSPHFDIWNEEYLGLNLIKRFPNVIFYKSDFDKSKYSVYLQKWYDMDKVFSRGYDSIFNFDIDSIFYGDIRFIFDKYNGDFLYALREGYNEHFFKVLGENGIPSGQLVIPKSVFYKAGNIFEKTLEKQKELIQTAKQKLRGQPLDWFISLSEQYAAQKAFKDSGVVYGHLDLRDIGMGIEDFEIICDTKNVETKLRKYKPAAGYMSVNYHLFLPIKYLENKDIKRRLRYCRDNKK